MTVSVTQDGKRVSVSLTDIIAGMQQRGLQMPVLLRIENLLDSQITLLNETFATRSPTSATTAATAACSRSRSTSSAGDRGDRPLRRAYDHGLEAGSKAELLIALAYLKTPTPAIICNGYKDEEFIDLALQSLKIGLPLHLRDRDAGRARR